MTLREVNKKVSIKSGMCIELGDGYDTKKMILFKTDDNALCYVMANNFVWDFMCQNDVLDKEYERIRVYTSPSSLVMFDEDDKVYDSSDKDDSIINVTVSDIAKLYGVSEDRIRIKARSEST